MPAAACNAERLNDNFGINVPLARKQARRSRTAQLRLVIRISGSIMKPATKFKIAEVHYEPDCPPEQVIHVLSALDRWSGRTARQVAHLRANDRHDYRTTVIIEPSVPAAPGEVALRQVFHVPTRNVSKAGLGFVAPPAFMTQ